ncbi:MAG: transmembrane anti-sigma factor [Bacteroidetes bacterium]|nr:MAG: transmembrane anti-sigma factor [Bacteroidota bacterium]
MNNESLKYHPLPEEPCLTEEQLYGYIDGKLSPADQHAVEKHLLDCGMCSDALDGLGLVKNRDKAAFIPPLVHLVNTGDKKEDTNGSEKGKVVPLFTRRHYAAAAAVIMIAAVAWFLRGNLSDTNKETADNAKSVTVAAADSMVRADSVETIAEAGSSTTVNEKDNDGKFAPPPPPAQEEIAANGGVMEDEADKSVNISAEGSKNADFVLADRKADAPPVDQDAPSLKKEEAKADPNLPGYYKAPADEKQNKETESKLFERSRDKNLFSANQKKSKTNAFEVSGKDKSKNRSAYGGTSSSPKSAEAGDAETFSSYRSGKDSMVTKSGFITQDNSTNKLVVTDSVSSTVANGQGVTLNTAVGGSGTYTWTNTVPVNSTTTGTVTNASEYSVTVTDVNGATTDTRNTPVKDPVPTEAQQYEQGMKFVQSNMQQAAIVSFDEVLKNPKNAHFEDAQWQKSIALLKLNKKAEAKVLLNAIVKKGGKYKALAESQLKQL